MGSTDRALLPSPAGPGGRSSPFLPGLLRSFLLAAAVWALAAGLARAQTGISYSRLDFQNAYRIDREDAWPNARLPGGNVAGDFVYKVFPVEVLARDREIRVSGLRLSFSVGNGYKGTFPVRLGVPEIAFYPVVVSRVGGRDLPLPDLSRRFGTTLRPPGISVPRDGVFVHEIRLGPHQPDPRLRKPLRLPARDAKGALQGWAVALLAPPGEGLGDGKPHWVPVPSYGEIHRPGSPSTFSGLYDAKKKRFLPYGAPGAPSNLGECGIELLLDGPALQLRSEAAGGVLRDPRRIETHLGPGAYESGLAGARFPGSFGLYAQWESREGDGLLCLPFLVALGNPPPAARLKLGAGVLMWDSKRAYAPSFFVNLGMFGVLSRYKAFGRAGRRSDQRGVFVSRDLPVPVDSTLRGAALWIQALFLDPKSSSIAGSSNLCRLRL